MQNAPNVTVQEAEDYAVQVTPIIHEWRTRLHTAFPKPHIPQRILVAAVVKGLPVCETLLGVLFCVNRS